MPSGQYYQVVPASSVGLSAKNLKATTNTAYTSNVLDLRGVEGINVVFTNTVTGSPSAGNVKIAYRHTTAGGTQIGADATLVTGIALTTNISCHVAMGYGVIPTAVNGTVNAAARCAFPLGYGKFVLTITTKSDGTACTGSVQIIRN